MALACVVAKVLERLEDLNRGAVALRVKQVVDIDEDLLKRLCSCQLLSQSERSGMSYVHAFRNGLWDGVDVAEATERLPLTQVSEVAAHVGFPIRIEDLNTPVATLLTSPTHVASQAMEFLVEAGLRIGLEAVELGPDVEGAHRTVIVVSSGHRDGAWRVLVGLAGAGGVGDALWDALGDDVGSWSSGRDHGA
jgi:hypothetical protein